jgi:uncharacterized protein YkwD
LAAVVVVVVGCSAPPPPPGTRPAALDDPAQLAAFQQELLDAHDDVRANAAPAPSPPLPPMSWSDDAAATAQDWANRCVFEHRQPNDFGENLALFSQAGVPPRDVVDLWASEAPDYDYADNACTGEQCGHYTQIVWRDSTGVGCGVADCDDVAGFGEGSLWVCNYDPPGNFIGERPY